MSLEGGRKLSWERSFNSESEVKPDRGFWNKLVDIIAGAPDYHSMVRPYSIATDSHGRIIVTDPGAGACTFSTSPSISTSSSSASVRRRMRCARRNASPSMRRTIFM